jgi:hypothetical protein
MNAVLCLPSFRSILGKGGLPVSAALRRRFRSTSAPLGIIIRPRIKTLGKRMYVTIPKYGGNAPQSISESINRIIDPNVTVAIIAPTMLIGL